MKDGAGTRQKIQEIALRLFVEKGIAETTVRDLASAAGIAEGTLYRHYESKDELVADLFAANYRAFAQRLTDMQPECGGFRIRLAAVTALFCAFFDEDPILFRFLWLAQHQALARIPRNADNPVDVLRRMVADAISKEEIGMKDSELATAIILGILLQPAVALVYARIKPPLIRHAEMLADACWRALNP